MSKLISEEYKSVLQKDHKPGQWGQTGKQMVVDIMNMAQKAQNKTSMLDYGAGHGSLRKALEQRSPGKYQVTEYEPGRPDVSDAPDPHEFVVCIDVLEHVEPDLVENVLDDLKRVVLEYGYFTISCRPAAKILSDGRNAHLIVEPKEWWKTKLDKRFEILEETYDANDKNYRVFLRAQ